MLLSEDLALETKRCFAELNRLLVATCTQVTTARLCIDVSVPGCSRPRFSLVSLTVSSVQ